MKNYVVTIIICAVILLLFPFLGLSEFWEHLFVIIPAFIIAYCGVWILRNIDSLTKGSGADSLQEYIESLQQRFKEQKKKHYHSNNSHRHVSEEDEVDTEDEQ